MANRAIIRIETPVFSLDIRSLRSPADDEAIRGLRSSADEANRFVDELRQQLAQRRGEIETLLFPGRN
jgi:hypothetical protein